MFYPVIDTDIPLEPYPPTFTTLKKRVDAAFAALATLGNDVPVSDEDIDTARVALAASPKTVETLLTSPGAVVHIKAILDEYDRQVVQSAAQIRTYVTNKLVEESAHKDARIRLRALELLGKISDVGLFTEKTEVTMRHRPTPELEQMLRERLSKIVEVETVTLPDFTTSVAPVTDGAVQGKLADALPDPQEVLR